MKTTKNLRDNDWFDNASCKGMNPSIFFPEDENVWPKASFVQGLCAKCPVRTECKDFSITSPYEEHGWWGMSEQARKPLRAAYRSIVNEIQVPLSGFVDELVSVDTVHAKS